MTNIITRDNIVIHATDDAISLPTSDRMIEFRPWGESYKIRVGGGDVNDSNCILHEGVTLPDDYRNYSYLYNGQWVVNPFNRGIE